MESHRESIIRKTPMLIEYISNKELNIYYENIFINVDKL